MNANKPVIPREVADAIESLRTEPMPYSTEDIVRAALNTTASATTLSALRTIPFDVLMSALVIGYEVERSAEDNLRDWYGSIVVAEGNTQFPLNQRVIYAARRDTVDTVLRILGIEIEGVNV